MAAENQITLFTDFDKTMTKSNTPIGFIISLFRRHPTGTVISVIRAFQRHGLNGRGFLEAISKADPKTRREIANMIVKKLSFKNKWKKSIINLTLKNPNIKNIKIVIITRNLRLIPQLFMELYEKQIRTWTGERFKGNFVVIGNENISNVALYTPKEKDLFLPNIINHSRDKPRFIKSKNAIYFGDKEDYDALVNNTKLKRLHYYLI